MMCAVLKCPSNKEHLVTKKKHYFPPFYSNDRLIEKKLKHEKKKRKGKISKENSTTSTIQKTCKKKVLGASVLSSKPVEKKHADSESLVVNHTAIIIIIAKQTKKISLNLSIA